MESIAIFTPDNEFLSLSDLIEHELKRVKPLGINFFAKSFEYSRLLGKCANFVGTGADHETQLDISYIQPSDPKAVDALSCRINRGDKRIYIAHYLTHMGHDPSFMSNIQRLPTQSFLVAAIATLGSLDRFQDLLLPMSGGDMIDIPFDYGGAR